MQARWAVAAMFLANGFVIGSWAPQIPLLLPRHGIGEGVVGLLILVMGLGAVGAMLFAGRLIGRHGARRVLVWFAWSVVPLLPFVVLAPNLPVLAVAMAALGALTGSMDVAMNAQAVGVERRLGRAVMSSSHGFWSLGGFLGGTLGGFVIAGLGPVAHALGVAAVVAGLVAVASPSLVDDPAPPAGTPVPARGALLPRDAGLWLLGLMALMAMVPEGAVLDWAALYLSQELGAPLAVSGLAFGLFAGAMAVVRFLGDAIRNRFGGVAVLRSSALLGAVGLAGAAMAPGPALAIAAFAVAGVGVANMVPVIFSAAGNHRGLGAGQALATVTMLGYSGILMAPGSIGAIAEHAGFRLTYLALAGLLVVVAAMAGRAAAADGVQTSPAT